MLLMSIRKEFADQILSGQKTVELRRRSPRVLDGERLAIYCPTPEMELIAMARVHSIIAASPQKLWTEVSLSSGLRRNEYDEYFLGAKQAVGIFLSEPIRSGSPISLSELREAWPGFHPPQEFRYLDDKQAKFVMSRFPRASRKRTTV